MTDPEHILRCELGEGPPRAPKVGDQFHWNNEVRMFDGEHWVVVIRTPHQVWSTTWPTEPGWYWTYNALGTEQRAVAEVIHIPTPEYPDLLSHRLDGRHLSPECQHEVLWGERLPEPDMPRVEIPEPLYSP